MNNKAEQERKELNKKLLKNTFKSEMKNRKRVSYIEFGIDFIAVFVGLLLSNWIVELLSIELWFVEMVIAVVLVMVMLSVGKVICERIVRSRE